MLGTEFDRRTFLKKSLVYSMGGIGLCASLRLLPDLSPKMKKLPGGFWPVMMTPFKDDMSIDYVGLKRLIRWYEDAGAAGLFANCASSEMYQLSSQERITLTRYVVEHTKLPVVSSGTFSGDQNVDAEFIDKVYSTGVDAVVLIPSIMVPREADESMLLKAFEGLLNKTNDIPLGIYECPGPYHRLIPLEILERLQNTGRFLYFKDTSCDAAVVDRRIEIVKSSSLGIYNAHAPDVLQSIRHGGSGISCIAGNFYPELFSWLWENGRGVRLSETAIKVNDFILANDSVIGKKYPLAAKYFMNIRGLDFCVNSRKKTGKLERVAKERLDELWKDLLYLANQANIELINYT